MVRSEHSIKYSQDLNLRSVCDEDMVRELVIAETPAGFINIYNLLICHSDTFLRYHPNIVGANVGLLSLLSSDNEYKKGIPNFISKMPRARFVEQISFTFYTLIIPGRIN